MTERIDSVDIAKGMGIILVIIGHSLTSDVQLRVWIYSFHIPLFFILSGIVINNDQIDSYSVTNFVQKNAKLVVNYIYFSFIYLLVDCVVRYLVLHQISLYSIAIEMYQTFILFGINVLWFIITLLLGKLLAVRILKSNMSKAQLLLTSIALFMISAMLSTLLPDRKSEMSTVVRLAYYAAVVILRVPMMSSFILLGYNFRRYIIEIENISSIKIGGGYLALSNLQLLDKPILWLYRLPLC